MLSLSHKKGFEYFRISLKMSNLDVIKKQYSKLKAMSKITKIPSEIRNFFKEKVHFLWSLSNSNVLLYDHVCFNPIYLIIYFVLLSYSFSL